MTAHTTPGPWTVLTTGGPVRVIAPLEKKRSGKQYQVVAYIGSVGLCVANANLISAALDLYDAIRLSDSEHWTPAMRAAMAKAEGLS